MQRAQPPRQGLWSIPSGFMERGETLQQAAARELYEECGVQIDPGSLSLYILGSITATSEVYAVFRGTASGPEHGIGPEALAVEWFTEEEAPWSQFAFPEVEGPMRRFYQDLKRGQFGLFMGEYTDRGNAFWPVDASRD
jgi:ADP-ribose pyrophosphatase YjhB (NUDIX family)